MAVGSGVALRRASVGGHLVGEPASSTATPWTSAAPGSACGVSMCPRTTSSAGARTAIQYPCGTNAAAKGLDSFLRQAADRLRAGKPRSIWADLCGLFGRRRRYRRLAGAQRLGARLAAIFQGQIRPRATRCGRSIRGAESGQKGSYVEPWLFRACIKRGGKPADCSDDANPHPGEPRGGAATISSRHRPARLPHGCSEDELGCESAW